MDNQTRYHLVDTIRGLAVVNMVLFHFCYDVFVIYGRSPDWYAAPMVYLWQQAICWTFLFTAGFSWRWGRRRNFRRGLLLNGFGCAISLITWLAVPSEAIWFGVLNLLGCAILLLIPLDRLLRRVPASAGLIGSLFVFALLRQLPQGIIALGGQVLLRLPAALYQFKLLMPLGFPYPGFRSSDYFPLLPWLPLVLAGYFAQPLVLAWKRWERIGRLRLPPLAAIGRYSIWIYLVHQPVGMLLCACIFGR